ncbi:MAG: hypothetical protein ACLP5H_07025 [Desulfomonilaceae bacterium]
MMKPVPRDDNGHPLLDRGTELFTHRIVGQDTTMSALSLPTDFKELLLHVESGIEILHVCGTVDGSTEARLTDSGISWTLPVSAAGGNTIAHLAAASGTCNISVFAWR